MARSTIVWGVGLLMTVGLVADDAARFQITCKRSDDRVEVKTEGSKTTFVIKSPSGIGKATIERNSDTWPEKVTLQLKLRGLESFILKSDDLKLHASLSSTTNECRVWLNDQEDSPLELNDPYWIRINTLDQLGKPTKTIPNKDGYIEISLPKKLLDANAKTLQFEWIDFYRN